MKQSKPHIFLILGLTVLLYTGLISSTISVETIENDRSENFELESMIDQPLSESSANQFLYPVMTDRTPEPWTEIENNGDHPPTASFNNLPSQFSWRSNGGDWTTPVRDQGSCGSCWAFSAIGIMEAAINLASGYPDTDIDLSEQYILSCLGAAGSCNGGWTDDALECIISTSPGSTGNGINGVPLESCMPYQANHNIPCSDKCVDWDTYSVPPDPEDILWQLQSWGADHTLENDDPNDRNIVKSWIIDKGPLSASMYASSSFQSFWNTHHSSTDVYFEEDHGSTNHAVVLVGWVDDPDVTNGGYWILKNSWGTGHGYGGYFNAAYGGQDIGERVRWCSAIDWPQSQKGPGPIDVDISVFSNFEYMTDEGTKYPHLGDEIQFNDISDGDVVLREWDFDGDGTIDSTKKNPTWVYMVEGEYEVTLTVHSEWGTTNNRTRIVEVREVWPPEAVCSPDEFVDNELEVSFDARGSHDVDGGRIVSYLWDFDDGSTSTEDYLTHVFPEGDREYEVTLTVTDNDGASSTDTCLVRIDQTIPPVTEIHHGFGCADDEPWYRSTQRMFFVADDWSEVISTFYRVDGGDWELYVEGDYIPVGGEGMHTVECYSVDFYGNEESVKSESFGIDMGAPSVEISVSGTPVDGWYDSVVSVSLSGVDGLSGLDSIIFKLDSGNWVDYSTGFSVDEGRHKLMVVAVDVAGNTVEESVDINVDIGSPSSNVIFVGDGSVGDGLFYQSVVVRFAASDVGSGVKDVLYRVDGGSFSVYEDGVSVVVDELGDHTVDFYAVDHLGNEEAVQSRSFSVLPVNFLLQLDRPGDALYVFNVELFSLGSPVIVGPVDVIALLDVFTGGVADVEVVEFVVDGEVLMQDTQFPFMWRLDTSLFGRHEIGVNVISPDGVLVSESVEALCIIP